MGPVAASCFALRKLFVHGTKVSDKSVSRLLYVKAGQAQLTVFGPSDFISPDLLGSVQGIVDIRVRLSLPAFCVLHLVLHRADDTHEVSVAHFPCEPRMRMGRRASST